ncbi:MAG: CRTAC1 family protein [Acidobacteriota bacterium]|nr:MAG: CRTAC1 family protein [Acidobacteriota bacterium]
MSKARNIQISGWRVALVVGLGFWALSGTLIAQQEEELEDSAPVTVSVDPIRYRNVIKESGIDFVLDNYMTEEKHMIETMPGGAATLDYNNDGRLDIYFTNASVTPSMKKESPRFYNRLYRNDGGMKFTDVTLEAGVKGEGYSMGVAVADYDNDGDVDIFVAGVYHNILFRNNGDSTFSEVTDDAGIKSDLWSVAAGWFDYDNDSYLDLFVVNYVEWTLNWKRFCGDPTGKIRVYCHPRYFDGLPNTLYRNRGDGTFEDVTEKSGILNHVSRGMSVAFEDYDRDGHLDAFVTNDKVPNFLFQNMGDGTFEEVALLVGVALREHGRAVSSMGAAFRDYNNDGLPDIWVTALDWETFPLFRNEGGGFYEDATYATGVARATIKRSAWSLAMFDFNNDGWKDLFTANAHANHRIELWESTDYRQANTVLANLKDGTFADVTPGVGPDFQVPRAHRGSAVGDFNGDGKIDIVVTAISDETELWENISPANNNWVIFDLEGTRSNRDGIGTQIRLLDQYNIQTTAVGYASSSYTGVHFGLGSVSRLDKVELLWPSGVKQTLTDVEVNRIVHVKEPAQ